VSRPARLRVDELGTVLGVWAHPDDECYLMAATALAASAAGSHVACVTATDGASGTTSDPLRWPTDELAATRRRELATSLEVLGLGDHTWLDLPDGGLQALDPAVGIGLVVEVIDRVRPDTVLTFGTDGMTGHPDHIAVGDWAERAVARVLGERCRVLAATRTRPWADAFAAVNAEVYDVAPPPCAPPEEIVLDVRPDAEALGRKVRALLAQSSQTAALASWMGADTYRAWVADEQWVDRRRVGP
jgi:LmbE family N-acetylglucosaminyl deacetylase